MLNRLRFPSRQTGTSLLEVLVTIVILAFGMLGLAGLQMKTQTAEMESYQRAQALVLMSDMVERITANRARAAAYAPVGSSPVWGTGNMTYANTACSGYDMSTDASKVHRDLCEWSEALKGSGELSSAAAQVGAMVGGRGCISVVQAADPSDGVCTPGIYEVAVAWQGLSQTSAPASTCGAGSYGPEEAARRVVTTRITVGLPGCT